MPLKGIITSDGEELLWEEYLLSKKEGLFPKAVRYALFDSVNRQRNRWISVTTVLYCLRKAKWEFEKDFFLKESNAYYFMRGNLLHEILASYKTESALIEEELFYTMPGLKIPIGGQLDRWENGILDDYKTISDNSIHFLKREGIKDEFKWQANIYKWMLKQVKGLETKEIRLIFIMMGKLLVSGRTFEIFDHKKQTAKVYELEPCPIYSDDKIESFLYPKLKRIEEGYAPPASPKPWLCEGCYFKDECFNKIGTGNAEMKKLGKEEWF